MANEDWLVWYHTLGIQVGQHDLAAIKKRYHFLIKATHPDRFSEHDPQRVAAEERAKSITAAYRGLTRYHRRFGVLPGVDEWREDPALTPSPPVTPQTRPTPSPAAAIKPRANNRRWLRGVVALLILSALYGGLIHYTNRNSEMAEDAEATTLNNTDDASDIEAFTYGDTVGTVYASQGVPTRIEGDLWFYGLSEVRFRDGHVVSWNEHPNHPLNVKITSDTLPVTSPPREPRN